MSVKLKQLLSRRPGIKSTKTLIYSKGAHSFSALIKWISQNDLPTTKMQNKDLIKNILRIIFAMFVDVPCIPTRAHVAQHN